MQYFKLLCKYGSSCATGSPSGFSIDLKYVVCSTTGTITAVSPSLLVGVNKLSIMSEVAISDVNKYNLQTTDFQTPSLPPECVSTISSVVMTTFNGMT